MLRSNTPILHVDMDAFYASVEVRDDPSLAGRPVAVGGPALGRGVIAAASYPARAFGVRSAMSTAEAQRLCGDLIVLPPNFEKYTAESRKIMTIFRSYTPLVEPLSLDEAFLDVSGCELTGGDPVTIGRAIKRDILRETGLVASVGIASSKFVAKLASDMDKPDGFRVIQPEEVQSVLAPLPVGSIFGVGPRTAKRLEAMGVRTIADLAQQKREVVMQRFGVSGAWIHESRARHRHAPSDAAARREELQPRTNVSQGHPKPRRDAAAFAGVLRRSGLPSARRGFASSHGFDQSALLELQDCVAFIDVAVREQRRHALLRRGA
jgi:nucleotidyltransferase/DNA polymerase involved in DNA repair